MRTPLGKHSTSVPPRILMVTIGLLLAAGSMASAGSYTWNSTSGGNWNDTSASGWNTGGTYPSVAGDSATFQQNFAANTTFTINVTDAVVGTLALNPSGDNRLYIAGGGADCLTFDASGTGTATLTWTRGQNMDGDVHDIQAPVTLNDNLAASGGNCLKISGDITGAGKTVTVNSSQMRFSGDNTGLTGGFVANGSQCQVEFTSFNSMGGGGPGSVFIGYNTSVVLGYTPSDANLAAAISNISPTSAGMFGCGYSVNEWTMNRTVDLSAVRDIRFGVAYTKIGITGGTLTFDFANNGNKYAMMGHQGEGSAKLDIAKDNYFTGNRGLDTGKGELFIESAQDYSGPTVVSGSGWLRLWCNGTILNSPSIAVKGSTLELSNKDVGPGRAGSPPAANLADRIGNSTPIAFYRGRFYYFGPNAPAADATETVGTLAFNQGFTPLYFQSPGWASGYNAILTAGNLQRTNNAVASLYSYDGIGGIPGMGSNSLLKFTTQPTAQLIGGGGGAGTTTISILPWMTDDTSFDSVGTFCTYDSANGLRGLNTATEYAADINTAAANENVRLLMAGTVPLSGNTTINSLILNMNGTSRALTGSCTLTLASGGLIVKGPGNDMSIAVDTLDLNGREGLFYSRADNLVSISSRITNDGGHGVVKHGNTTMRLTKNGNDYTGPTVILQGTMEVSAGAIPTNSEVRIGSGASFAELAGGNRQVIIPGASGTGTLTLQDATSRIAIGGTANAPAAGMICLQDNGFISPGDAGWDLPGVFSINNGQSTNLLVKGGTVNIRIASPNSADQVLVGNGSVNITGGTLNVTFLDDYAPRKNDEWKIVNVTDASKTCRGAFTHITSPPGSRFQIAIRDNDLYLRGVTGGGTVIIIK